MADGKLKLLDMYARFTEIGKQLMEDSSNRSFYDMSFLRLHQQITLMNAEAGKLYGQTANGAGDVTDSLNSLRMNYLDFYSSLKQFNERYMEQTSAPDGKIARMLRELERDVQEDQLVLQGMKYEPGQSLMESVYRSQKDRELAMAGQDGIDVDALPGEETVHRMDYPSFETVHGLPHNGPTEEAPPMEFPQYPSLDTLRMHEGNLGGPAVQPYEQQELYGTDTFYQNQMDLPDQEEVKREEVQKLRKSTKYMQIWTVAPLTNAIVDETAQSFPAASNEMIKINRELQTLFHAIQPYNPHRGEAEPRIPSAEELQELKQKTQNAYGSLSRWKQGYLQNAGKPSPQVVFLTDIVMKKLEDDFKVLSNVNPGAESLPEAAFRCSGLPRHYGFEADRKTPAICPERKAEAAARAEREKQARQAAPNVRATQEQRPGKNADAFSPQQLNRAFFAMIKVGHEMEAADPKWMLSSSGAYGKMKKEIGSFRAWARKNRQHFRPSTDRSSPEYKQAVKELKQYLTGSRELVAAYLDKKDEDFRKDRNRREDPGRQKWEQRRIRNALDAYETLSSFPDDRSPEHVSAEKQRLAGYRDTLLSSASKRLIAEEKRKQEDEAQRQQTTETQGPARSL